jgi:hypothetical protein
MERNNPAEGLSFFERLGMAWRLIIEGEFARQVGAGLKALAIREAAPPPERLHASGLMLLSALQREGRLLDFVQQEVAGFSDQEVGAAARVVHAGCRKVLRQYFQFEPAAGEPEGSAMTVAKGFDAQRIRLTGKVAGQPPFRGTLKHHGWVATEVRMPALADALDPRVVAPAEVELG